MLPHSCRLRAAARRRCRCTGSSSGNLKLTSTPFSRGSFTPGLINSVTDLSNTGPRVAMFPTTAGTAAPFVVTWASYLSSNSNYNIFAETFNSKGTALTAAFQVNEAPVQLAAHNLASHHRLAIDARCERRFARTHLGRLDELRPGQCRGRQPVRVGLRHLHADVQRERLGLLRPDAGNLSLEFRVNATTLGNQVAAVASDDPSDNSVVVWVGPDTLAAGTTAIYSRVIDPPAAGPAKALLPAAGTPVVTTNPASQSVTAGAAVTFSAAASGSPTPKVQWQLSTNNGGTFSNVTGATGNSYTFTAATSESGYEYRAVFTNSISSATSTAATLKVGTPIVTANSVPAVTTNPASQGVNPGTLVTFTAAASGSPAPTVQWQSSANGLAWGNIAGATKTSYSVTAAATMSGSMYRAVFTNSVGTATTSSAVLTVYAAPAITINPASQAVAANAQAVFTAAASGSPAPTVQWQSSANGTTWSNITGATTASLPIVATAANSGTQYRAVFTNSLGTATTTAAKLTVGVLPVVLTGPYAMSVAAGATVTYTASASGMPAQPCNGR